MVVITNKKRLPNWEYLKISPHVWDNQKTARFIGSNSEEIKAISQYLLQIINDREESGNESDSSSREVDYRSFKPYFLIIIDDLKAARKTDFLKKILESKTNYGFSLLFKNDRISNLPSEVNTFINIDEEISGLFENELVASKQKQFKAEFNTSIDIYGCIQKLANIPIQAEKAKFELPKSISFLDMYNVGRVEQLNSLQKWRTSNPITSLSVPVGIDQNGDLFMMDAHENAYGPHGLIAGTTGSGKSEWIITYILSLSISFSPEEVQFVIIDYKGGGLAGSFENKEIGIRLPHLVGTITNLDKSEIRRTLASIEAELKRRQRMFNEAREKLKDSSMNIYKYQDYYRKGLLSEPMSHLFIISDEFAELKSQEPEFLDQLVSTARIGRSLGVHLILATQKPSGVVNDQIWSNARFHVALRVQDPSDSNEMIKTKDAAYLKTTGSFYLQVGNNEFYGLGQSAYAGFKYEPSDVIKKQIDTDIHIVGPTGNETHVISPITTELLEQESKENLGEQLLNILKYIDSISKQKKFNIRRLWLDAIPAKIYIDNLKKKYGFKKENFIINPPIGEYDNPYTQSQHLYTLPITKEGNTVIYGKVGSGKELLLQSLIYSLSTTYTLKECEVYIIDCGAEILRVFDNNPMVGNYVTISEVDKIDGVLKYIRNQIILRKNIFADFGGNYEQYIKTSGKTLPNIVVILNNFQPFYETYEGFSELLQVLLRDCSKYGITFVISNVSQLSSRISNSLPYKICLNQDEEGTYREIMGEKISPANYKTRGLINVDGRVFEFQGAIPVPEDKINDTIKKLNAMLLSSYKTKVPSVPYLPTFITYDFISNQISTMERFPIGIRKISISTEFVNFKKELCYLISSKNGEMLNDIMANFTMICDTMRDQNVYLLDASSTLDNYIKNNNVIYAQDNFDEIIKNLYIYTEDLMKTYNPKDDPNTKEHTYVIINKLEKFQQRISSETADFLSKAIMNAIQLKTITFILSDTMNSVRTITSEPWYLPLREHVNGLWVGNGANEQSIIETMKFDIKPTSQGIPENYGYNIIGGVCVQIKLIEFEKEMEDDF